MHSATRAEAAGETVLRSISTCPGRMVSTRPPGPVTTESRARSFGTMERRMSASSASAAAVTAGFAPAAAIGASRAGSVSVTDSAAPASINRWQSGVPMRPTPIQPSFQPSSAAMLRAPSQRPR
jgi:anti-sigma factor RsiW